MICPQDGEEIQQALELNKYPQNSGDNLCACCFLYDYPVTNDSDWFHIHAQILAAKWGVGYPLPLNPRKGRAPNV